LQSKPVDQLIELLLGCAARDHEFRAVLSEQQALQGGNVKKLVQEARCEIASATAEPAWSESWEDEDDSPPNFDGVQRRLRTLLDAGHADAVVELGRELIPRGLERVSQADDDFESSGEFTDCLEVVFQAVVKSSLAPCQKLVYAIEAVLQDDYDMTTPAHYEVAAGYLRKVRNLLTSLDRTPEWNARLASLRETQRRKRRLIEILDGLAGRPIVHPK
jgi:uncharacterized Zn finger protein